MKKMPIPWEDKAYFSAERTVLTEKELNIPGLTMLGKHHMTTAIAPLPDHFHKDCYEFTLVFEGTMRFTVEHLDYEVSRGELFFTKPNEVHSTNNLPLAKGDILWFQLDTNAENLLFLSNEATNDLKSRLSNILGHKIPQLSKTSLAIARALTLDLSQTYSRFTRANDIVHLLYQMLSHLELKERKLTCDIAKVITYISQELQTEIAIEDLAQIAQLSVSQFKQKFKDQVGMAPRNYVNLQKVEAAKEDLLKGHTVTEVAMNYGFSSSSYFVVAFKRYMACTPTQFVKEQALELPDFFMLNTHK